MTYYFGLTRPCYRRNDRRSDRDAMLNARRRARRIRRDPNTYKGEDDSFFDFPLASLRLIAHAILFFACMHALTVMYMLLAYMISHHALIAIPFIFAPKRADKFTLLFLATLHYALAIPIVTTSILIFAYIAWHHSPSIRALPFYYLGFSIAFLIHISCYIFSTFFDHLFSPITSALCYCGRLACLSTSIGLAITTRAIRYTFILSSLSHSVLERVTMYWLPNHQPRWYTSSNQPPTPNDFASALAHYVRTQASISPHSQYFAQYFTPRPTDRLAYRNILPSFFAFLNASRARFFDTIFSILLFQSKLLSHLLEYSLLFFASAQEQYEVYCSSRYRIRFASNLFRVLKAYIRPLTYKPLILMCLILMASATSPEDPSSRPPTFDGTRANFISWVISFSGWLAWRLTDATVIADHSETLIDILADEPDPVAEPVDHHAWTLRRDKWHAANRKLYGAILQAVPDWLRTSIFHDHRNDGASALEYLHMTFDANDANDNAAHVARLGIHHIDPKSDLNEDNLRFKYIS